MPNPLIGIGTVANDGTGDPLRTGFQKINRLPNPDSTVNAASGDYSGTVEQKITAAIAAAALAGSKYVNVPQSMLPYNASLVTFNNAVRMIGEGINPAQFSLRAYGATGDGVANDTTSINAALNAAAALSVGGGVGDAVVYAAPGVYGITSQIIIPYGVILRGDNTRSCEIKALSGFPASTALVRLGPANSGQIFNCRLDSISVNCNGVTGAIGVYATDLQDQCGCINVLCRNYTTKGIFWDASAGVVGSINRAILQDIECYSTLGGAGTIGVHIKGPVQWPLRMMGISCESPTVPGDQGILVENGTFFVGPDIYAGFYTDAVKFTNNAFGGAIGVTGNTCTNVLTHGGKVFGIGIYRAGGTNTINDTTGPDSQITGQVGIYTDGGDASPTQAGFVSGRGVVSTQRTNAALGAGNNNNYSVFSRGTARLSAAGGGSTITGIVADVAGMRLRIINVSANTLTISNNDVNSSAANRILTVTGANIALAQNQWVDLEYDGTSAIWRAR
jgi:hypothetical protein